MHFVGETKNFTSSLFKAMRELLKTRMHHVSNSAWELWPLIYRKQFNGEALNRYGRIPNVIHSGTFQRFPNKKSNLTACAAVMWNLFLHERTLLIFLPIIRNVSFKIPLRRQQMKMTTRKYAVLSFTFSEWWAEIGNKFNWLRNCISLLFQPSNWQLM